MISRRQMLTAFAAAAAVTVAALGAGCGSTADSEARQAAPATAPVPEGSAAAPKGPKGAFLDTRMEVTNKTTTTKSVVLGAGCIDPSGMLPITLKPGESTAATGWCAYSAADISGIFKWDCGFLYDCKSAYFTAGNPKIGWPWMVVDGQERGFAAGERCSFSAQGQYFEAYRGPDLSGAKDMRLAWVDQTSLARC